ncbi:MAG: hydrogenase maturation nickel metallochaperone HypA [Armatimonadota bacterium]|nr:hydrogenase maturation nickel metallochaperone HypA [Armatimonadota bacterium]MDR7433029.1 hydrogenase maturation nickel metallochaperone HypA [Armatimonadota bacterium]MDR7530615.1 hydrogenase maturation nickel metallochaperone HypA [Armatimonadota bacterium]MDR7595744.1 hydrogenase maturation nickel metallochaperone HypA [Armatimonadota bacterium]MDR7599874.1 hydrogenase maturation nickel metallochaperone HypA [Armatimonadota bacterium]
MHERGLVQALVRRLEEVARSQGAVRVTAVRVRLGPLAGVSQEHFREHFQELTRGTVAERCRLEILADESLEPRGLEGVMVESVDLEG